ncbi:MAG: hypothetical protein KGY61_00725 [Desulfobacterales bacterium]|nr:hypothetical protein [Desulfobacterales bacterium]
MGPKDEDDNLNEEVSSRLDELFGGEGPEEVSEADTSDTPSSRASDAKASHAEDTASTQARSGEATPIDNLKALVFSIDWEINDETMKAFLQEVRRLKAQYEDDRILLLFLKLHESLGKYIKAKKAKAHPDAIKLVTSVYKKFEKALLSSEMGEAEKKKIIAGEVKKYKKFKQRVLARKEVPATSEPVLEAEEPAAAGQIGQPPPNLSPESREMADYILSEVKKTLQEEFRIMRQLIKNMGA